MAQKYCDHFSRGLAFIDFILEGNGHSIAETATEFRLSKNTIQRDINLVGLEAFYCKHENAKELQEKYIKMRKTLVDVAKRNHVSPNAKISKSSF